MRRFWDYMPKMPRRASPFVPHRTPRFVWLKRLARAAPPPLKTDEEDAEDALVGATRLMQLALCAGMAVEVYVPKHGRRFWAAHVEAVEADGFWYRFDGDAGGGHWCPRDGFLSCWRFPLADEADVGRHFTYRNVRRLLAAPVQEPASCGA